MKMILRKRKGELMSKLTRVLAFMLAFGFSLFAAAAEMKVAVVDLPTAIQSTTEGKKIKKLLEDEFNKKKKDLEKRYTDINKMQADFDKKSLVLTEDARVKKQQEIDAEKNEFMQLKEKNLQELAKRDRELSQPLIKKLNEVIAEIAKKDGYTVILHKNEQNLVWASKEIDITEAVIKALEKK